MNKRMQKLSFLYNFVSFLKHLALTLKGSDQHVRLDRPDARKVTQSLIRIESERVTYITR